MLKIDKRLPIAVVFLLALVSGPVLGQIALTNTWTDYAGNAQTAGGIAIPVGFVVNAYDPDSVLCGTDTVIYAGMYGWLHVYGDDPNTALDEGAEIGDTITFYFNGHSTTPDTVHPWMGNRIVFYDELLVANEAPEFVTTALPDALEDSPYEFALDAADADGDPVTFASLAAPAWMSISANGIITGQPGNDDVGSQIPVEIEVTDAYWARDTLFATVTVINVNDPPGGFTLLQPAADSVILIYLTDAVPEDSAITFTWSRAEDVDGDPLEYFVTFDGALAGLGSHTVSDTILQISYPLILESLYVSEDSILTGNWWVSVDDGMVSTQADNNGRTLNLHFDIDLATNTRAGIPARIDLLPAYPNPFNPSTTLRFDLPEASVVRLTVYDMLGREVSSLADGRMEAGYHRLIWDGRDTWGREIPTGIYIARLVTPEYSKSIKMMMMK